MTFPPLDATMQSMPPVTDTAVDPIAATTPSEVLDVDLIEDDDELLIEEISIDGMCGVY